MKPKQSEILMPDHAMYTDAVDALRRYHEAQRAGGHADEVERLRLIAESQFQAVSDYQLRVIAKVRGKVVPPLHCSTDRQLPVSFPVPLNYS